jgi:hypothetical protein
MTTEKQITSIKIDDDLNGVKIGFGYSVLSETESQEEENDFIPTQYHIKSKLRPHKDFIDSMKQLRKHGLEICEMAVDSKELKEWTVAGFKIAGDMILHKSRVVLEMSKKVQRTNKIIKFKTPQVTMFPEKEDELRYVDAEKLTVLIEAVIDQAWAYLNGKFEDSDIQLKLFETSPRLETNFTQ